MPGNMLGSMLFGDLVPELPRSEKFYCMYGRNSRTKGQELVKHKSGGSDGEVWQGVPGHSGCATHMKLTITIVQQTEQHR